MKIKFIHSFIHSVVAAASREYEQLSN